MNVRMSSVWPPESAEYMWNATIDVDDHLEAVSVYGITEQEAVDRRAVLLEALALVERVTILEAVNYGD